MTVRERRILGPTIVFRGDLTVDPSRAVDRFVARFRPYGYTPFLRQEDGAVTPHEHRGVEEPRIRVPLVVARHDDLGSRVLEDRSLIRELINERDRPGRLAQLGTVGSYVLGNTARLLTGRLKRYGRAAVNFGTPLSVRSWLATAPDGVLAWPKERRLPELERLAQEMLHRIGAIVPVTPVPLAAAALLSFEQTAVARAAVLERMDQLRDRLLEVNGKVVRGGARIEEVWDRAWRMLRMRRLVVQDGDTLVVRPRGRPLLEYYANSIAHLLPLRGPRMPFHKEHERETDLARLKRPSG